MHVVEPTAPTGQADEWVAGVEDHALNAGPYPSLNDALQHAPRDLMLTPGDPFYIGQRVPYMPTVDARVVIDQVGEETFQNAGDQAEHFLVDIADEELVPLQRRLQFVFDEWLNDMKKRGALRKVDGQFWQISNVENCVFASADEGGYVVVDEERN